MAIRIRLSPAVVATLVERRLGRWSDPRLSSTIILSNVETGDDALFTDDGLGRRRFAIHRADDTMREEEWFTDARPESRERERVRLLRVNLLAKRATGFTFEQAEAALLRARA